MYQNFCLFFQCAAEKIKEKEEKKNILIILETQRRINFYSAIL